MKNNIRIYDNGGKSIDRYTVMFMDQCLSGPKIYTSLGMSTDPFIGFGQYCMATPGRHLGRRIAFEDLPENCQKFLLKSLEDLV